MAFEFTIPGRPQAKERPRAGAGKSGGRARIYTPTKTLKNEANVREYCRLAMEEEPYCGAPLLGPVKVEVLAVFDIPKSWSKAKRAAAEQTRVWHTSAPDADNVLKLVLDAVNPPRDPLGSDEPPHGKGYAFRDDGQVVDARCSKRFGQPERTVVRITPLADWNDG